ncbi:pyridoxamine 5'-phosphate oxidase family protein [Nocardioides astragali]|uniref:Pyridoxamine 5'-phosphate oxidase family protein n=1 Tax=Nocardioides astragali TaxID=1776736 RepID=A0ABW2N582_9ACTN|nr:pyridoxamine 5'-phosphate oxidase family protein [Nocardioides astragali]
MLDPANLSGGAVRFLASQTFAILTGRDHDGVLWTSPLTGPAGFLEATDPNTLRVNTAPSPGDPLHALDAGQPVGLLVIDFTKRRRYRINGWLAATAQGRGAGLTIEADQAYGNCPQYIQPRDLTPDTGGSTSPTHAGIPPADDAQLSEDDIAQVTTADTFFLGTTHPKHGNDASHRGGPPGFVRIHNHAHLWWPDYAGNNMFNSLGNLAVDPTAALLCCDFTTGRTLHLSGTAQVEHTDAGVTGDDGDIGRRVTFAVERTRTGAPLPLRAAPTAGQPRNAVPTA